MKNRSFTILEITIVVVIVGILASIGYPTYRNVSEDAQSTACKANLQALQAAFDSFVYENDKLPSASNKIPREYLDKAMAQVLKQKGAWKIKLAYFIVDFQNRGLAYAVVGPQPIPTFLEILSVNAGNRALLNCPVVAAGQNSYGINSIILDMTSQTYRAWRNANPNTPLIGDCAGPKFGTLDGSDLTKRHKHFRGLGSQDYANGSINGEGGNKFNRVIEF